MKFSKITALLISAAFISGGFSSAASANEAGSDNAKDERIIVNGQQGRFGTDVFVKKANMQQPRLSPDGTKLAYMMNDKGTSVLALLDLETAGAKPKVIMAGEESRESGDRSVDGHRWVGNDNIVVSISMFEDLGNGPGSFSRLVSYNIKTGKIQQLAWDGAGGGAADIQNIDHEKGEIVVERDVTNVSNERLDNPQVVKVDVNTGKVSILQNPNPEVRGWEVDGAGVVRAGVIYDGDTGKLKMLYRSNPKENLVTVMNSVREFTGGAPEPELFLPGTDEAYAMSRQDGFNKIYKMNIKTGEIGKPIYETAGFDIDSIIPNKDRNDIDGYVTFNGTYKDVWLNPLHQEIIAGGESLFGKGQVRLVNLARNESKAILAVGGTKKHNGFYLFDLKSGGIKLLNWRNIALADTPMNPVKAEWYTARDGMKLQAIVTYPRHRTGKNLPVVIMPHGGPFGAISATNQNEPWSQPLAEAGYVVIQPNYRGSGGYGKEYEEAGRKKDGYGVKMQDDLNDLLKIYGDKGIVDPNRACIMGWSYGGYAAARGAQRDGNVWKCAIAGAGVYDFPLMTAWDKKNLGKFSSGFQATSDDPKGISSAHNTDGKWAPILIVSAARDRRIPLEQARTLVSRLKGSGKVEGTDFKYIEQKQGTHNLPYDDVHIQWIQEAEAWLARFNPAYIASDTDKSPQVTGAATAVASK
jgi:dipeptidyl aminopeptidase/acylaminoacyl peptidase